jgi:hypothetical protein
MNTFTSVRSLAETRLNLKKLKAHDYEYCIVAMNDGSTVVLSNSELLSIRLRSLVDDFSEIKLAKKERAAIFKNQMYKTTMGNHGLLLE